MKVRRLTLAAGIVLLLCLVAWVRSYLPENWALRAHQGALVLVFYDNGRFASPASETFNTMGALADARAVATANFWVANSRPVFWQVAGFELIVNRQDLSSGYAVFAVPFWFIILPLAAATTWGVVRWRRDVNWWREKRCKHCGYDLRGTPQACPECGNAAA